MRVLRAAGLSLILVMSGAGVYQGAYAASDTTTHSVTISVPTTLSIAADTSNFTLTMSDFVSGAQSNTQTVNYTITSNNNNVAANGTVLSAALGSAFTDLNLFADPGTYTRSGGNFNLVEAAAGNITIGTTSTALAKKTIVSGTGKITRGTLPVAYKAVATQDLAAGTQAQTLTITLVDA